MGDYTLDEQLAIALAQYGDAILTIEECEKIKTAKRAEITSLKEQKACAESLKHNLAKMDAKLSKTSGAEVPEPSESV